MLIISVSVLELRQFSISKCQSAIFISLYTLQKYASTSNSIKLQDVENVNLSRKHYAKFNIIHLLLDMIKVQGTRLLFNNALFCIDLC